MSHTKGIILAGGAGSRLYPMTRAVSKQLLPVYDKPLIYYPISVLMLAGIRQIAIITTPGDVSSFKSLLGDGSSFGIELEYLTQPNPEGIAQGLIIAEEFIGDKNICMVLGDNIFWGHMLPAILKKAIENNSGGTVFGYNVKDPHRFGVIEFDAKQKVVSIEEKPQNPKSNFVVTGLYIYDNRAISFAKKITPSERGELEITDVNNLYLEEDDLNVELFGRGFAWLDTGTHDSLYEATKFVETIQNRQGFKIACLEEIGFVNGWLSKKQLSFALQPRNAYQDYILQIVKDAHQ